MAGRPPGVVRHRDAVFWVAAATGWLFIAWGLRGAVIHQVDTRPGQLLGFFAAGLATHDLFFAPAVLAAGVVFARAVPARWRSAVQAALFTAGTAMLYAYPLVRGYGHSLNNPTSLPRNYAAGLIIVVAALCAAVGVSRAAGLRSSRFRRRGDCRRPGGVGR